VRLSDQPRARNELAARGGCELTRDVALQLLLAPGGGSADVLQRQRALSRLGACVANVLDGAAAASSTAAESALDAFGVDLLHCALHDTPSSSAFASAAGDAVRRALYALAADAAVADRAAGATTRDLTLTLLASAETRGDVTAMTDAVRCAADLVVNEQAAAMLCDENADAAAQQSLLDMIARFGGEQEVIVRTGRM
jgi:hypothetical protein